VKNSNELDQIIRQKLQDHTYTPPMHLWNDIDERRTFWQRLPNLVRYKYRKQFGALLFGSLALLLTWGVVNHYHSEGTNLEGTEAAILQPTSSKGIISENVQSTVVEDDTTIAPEQTTKTNSTAITSTEEDIPKTETDLVMNNKVDTHTPKSANNGSIMPDRTHSTVSNIKTVPSSNPAKTPSTRLNNDGSSYPSMPSFLAQEDITKNTNQEQGSNRIQIVETLMNTPSVPLIFEEDKNSSMPGLRCPTPDHDRNFTFSLDIFGSPDIAFTEIAGPADQSFYAAARRSTETFDYAFSGGLRFSATNRKGVAFRTGINYTQINEKFDHTGNSDVIDSITTVEDATGQIIRLDTTFKQIHTQSNNQFTLVDIPVILGYEAYVLNNRIMLMINGGAYLNIKSKPVGQILDEELLPANVDPSIKGALAPFKDNFGVSIYGSLGVGYRFNTKVALIVEPNFRYFVQPITNENYVLKQGYLTTGLTTGIRVQL